METFAVFSHYLQRFAYMTCGGFRSTFLSASTKFTEKHKACIYHFSRHKLYTLLN